MTGGSGLGRLVVFASFALMAPLLAASSLAPVRPAAFAVGGPDGYGYHFVDSQESNGPDYSSEYEDISSSGTAITWTAYSTYPAANEGHQEVQLGFPFSFYGNSYTSTWVNTNFFLKFGGPTTVTDAGGTAAWITTALPSTQQPNCIFAKWQDPATVTARYSSLGTTPNRRFLVTWNDGNETVQAKLYENGQIILLYVTITNGSNGTVGIQNSSGTVGLQYTRNGNPSTLANGRAIRFFIPTNQPPFAPSNVAQAGDLPQSSLQAQADPAQLQGWTRGQVSFSANVADPNSTLSVRLRVRVKSTTSPTWTLLDSGLQAQGLLTIPYSIPASGDYDWEYRVENQYGYSYPTDPAASDLGWIKGFTNNISPDFRSDQEAAQPPQALTPGGGGDVSSPFSAANVVRFTWAESADNGPSSALRYDVQVSRNNLFTDIETAATGLAVTTTDLSVTVSRTPKHWRVRSTDISGNVSPWSNVQQFRLTFDDQVDHASGDATKACGFSVPGSGANAIGLLAAALAALAVLARRRR